MLRSILALTTAISLTLPMAALAQSEARETVRDVLDRYGYEVAQGETLTTPQVAEIYLTATSAEGGDIRMLLSGMDLKQDMSGMDLPRTEGIDARVREILAEEGYAPEVIDFMTDGEVVQIYLAATSEPTPDLDGELAAMGLPRAGEMVTVSYDASANVRSVVETEMTEMGYSRSQIDALTEEEVAEVYLALTSEDANEIRAAIDGALAS